MDYLTYWVKSSCLNVYQSWSTSSLLFPLSSWLCCHGNRYYYIIFRTWESLGYHFFKLQVHILHTLENISIFNIWKLWLVRCDVIFSGTSLILPKMSENFWSKEIPLWWFPDSTLKLNNSRTTWPIPAIYISFSSILNALSYEINLFSRCSSPLTICKLHKYVICEINNERIINE